MNPQNNKATKKQSVATNVKGQTHEEYIYIYIYIYIKEAKKCIEDAKKYIEEAKQYIEEGKEEFKE